ncbi:MULTISPECIES: YybH family protein [unclassified Variovorax]|uniref:YybH family protein n=1 Tax=unclassified Variovorax TaxID=663243 RepID=UPI003ED139CE
MLFKPWRPAPRPSRRAAQAGQRAEIEQLLNKYEHALNTGDVNAAVQLYTDDGVFMAPESPTAIGTKVLREAYAGVFQAIALKLKFQIAEAKLLSPEWAMLRTTSSGTVKIVANGAEIPDSNQELFLLRKTGGQWKIARYSFSSVLPRAK